MHLDEESHNLRGSDRLSAKTKSMIKKSLMPDGCRECKAIKSEWREACIEYLANASEELKEALRLGKELAGGTEEDVIRFENLPRPRVVGSSAMAELRLRQAHHCRLTGHYVQLRAPHMMTGEELGNP
jgi:hypothetical protein